jgi:hypothetical protein
MDLCIGFVGSGMGGCLRGVITRIGRSLAQLLFRVEGPRTET